MPSSADPSAPVRARGPRRRLAARDGAAGERDGRRPAGSSTTTGRAYERSIEAVASGRDHDGLQPAEERQVLPQGRREPRRHGRLPRPGVPAHGDQRRPVHGTSRGTARRRRRSTRSSRPGSPPAARSGASVPTPAVTRGRMARIRDQGAQADGDERRPVRRRPTRPPRSPPRSTASRRRASRSACGSHRFCPNRDISRAETAGFLQRARSITRVTAAQPAPGNPDGSAPVPPGAGAADSSSPDHVIGNGTPASCTSRRSSAPSPRAASSPSTAARSRSRSRWPRRPRCSTTSPTS